MQFRALTWLGTLFFIGLLLSPPTTAQAPALQWATYLNGAGKMGGRPLAFALDANRNIYATGSRSSGLTLVKFDANGTVVWQTALMGPLGWTAEGRYIRVDREGNAVVAGIFGKDQKIFYLVAKFDPSGNKLWSKLLARNPTLFDVVSGLEIDSRGNIIVSGTSYIDIAARDLFTVSLDPTGIERWRASLDVSGSTDEEHALTLDADDNVLITGFTSYNGYYDYLTAKYSPNGIELWRKLDGGAANGRDEALAISTDSLRNVYVSGFQEVPGGISAVTIKYNSNGAEQWRANVAGRVDANCQVVDKDQNLIVLVKQFSGSSVSYLLRKYDPQGNLRWQTPITPVTSSNLDQEVWIRTDANGNIVVLTSEQIPYQPEYATRLAKYDSNGAELWRVSNVPLGHMRLDENGDVYAFGATRYSDSASWVLTKINSAGIAQWRTEWDSSNYNPTGFSSSLDYFDKSKQTALDSDGSIYVAGTYTSVLWSNSVQSSLLIKLGANGQEIWRRETSQAPYDLDAATAIALDSSANIVVAGLKAGSTTALVVLKFDKNGNLLFRTEATAAGATLLVASVVVDSADRITVLSSATNGQIADLLSIQFDSAGGERWRIVENTTTPSRLVAGGLAVDANGNIGVSGEVSTGAYPTPGCLIALYSPSGQRVWKREITTPAATNAQRVIAFDAQGNLIFGGANLTKVGPTGSEIWHTAAEALGTYSAMAMDASGAIFLGTSTGQITKLSVSGFGQWRRVVETTRILSNGIPTLTTDALGNVYVAANIANQGAPERLVVKYSTDGSEAWRLHIPTNIDAAIALVLKVDGYQNLFLFGGDQAEDRPYGLTVYKYAQSMQPPTITSAFAGNGKAFFRLAAPSFTGGQRVSGYVIVCNPGNLSTTNAALLTAVTGLTNGIQYSCTASANTPSGVSPQSYPVFVTPSPNPPLSLVGVESRKGHANAGTFGLLLNLVGATTIEPRAIGAGHEITFIFNDAISSIGGANFMVNGGGLAQAPYSIVGNEVTLTLATVPDKSRIMISLAGANGGLDSAVTTAFLLGDVTCSGRVTASDIVATKVRGGTVSMGNFAFDINLSGTIDATDASAVRARTGNSLQ